jgi:hypothetical protein
MRLFNVFLGLAVAVVAASAQMDEDEASSPVEEYAFNKRHFARALNNLNSTCPVTGEALWIPAKAKFCVQCKACGSDRSPSCATACRNCPDNVIISAEKKIVLDGDVCFTGKGACPTIHTLPAWSTLLHSLGSHDRSNPTPPLADPCAEKALTACVPLAGSVSGCNCPAGPPVRQVGRWRQAVTPVFHL